MSLNLFDFLFVLRLSKFLNKFWSDKETSSGLSLTGVLIYFFSVSSTIVIGDIKNLGDGYSFSGCWNEGDIS